MTSVIQETDIPEAFRNAADEQKPQEKARQPKQKWDSAAPKGKAGKKSASARKAPKAAEAAKAPKAAKPAKSEKGARQGSKTAIVRDLMERPKGATLAEIIKATGWQPHSVWGFISGTLGKKMGLTVTSAKRADGERVYGLPK